MMVKNISLHHPKTLVEFWKIRLLKIMPSISVADEAVMKLRKNMDVISQG